MEKTLTTLSGRSVRFASTAGLPVRYKAAFGTDMFHDLAEMEKQQTADISTICQLLWAMAKTADKSIPPVQEWLDSFTDGLPLLVWFSELSPMIAQSMRGEVKNAQAAT